MTSRFDQEFEDIDVPPLFEEFGETVTRYPDGDKSPPAPTLTAIWDEDEKGDVEDNEQHQRIGRSGILTVPDSQTVSLKDRWLIRGEEWETVDTGHPDAGTRELMLIHNDNQKFRSYSKKF